MSTEPTGLSEPKVDEIEKRLDRAAQQDHRAPVVFACRCALRVFPMLAWPDRGDFFWPDGKAKSLLSVWWSLVSGYTYQNTPDVILSSANVRNIAARASLGSLGSLGSENNKIVSAMKAADFDSGVSSNKARKVLQGIKSATSVNAFVGLSVDTLLDKEFSILEEQGTQRLKVMPLWLDYPDSHDYLNLVEKYLPEALHQLAEQSQEADPAGAAIIEQIYPLYMGLYKGKPDEQGIIKALAQLELYFYKDKQEQSEAAKKSEAVKLTGGIESNVDISGQLQVEENQHQNTDPEDSTVSQASLDTHIKATYRQSIHTHAPEDKLDRQQLINTLAAILLEPSNSGHQTIGLLGDWGVGKTSVVNLLKDQLLTQQAEQPFLFAEFNAWEYEHTNNLQAGIAQEMIKALTSPDPVKSIDWKHPVSGLGKFVWLGVKNQVLWRLWRFFVLTFCFAVRMHGVKLLPLLGLLLAAFLPAWWSELKIEPFITLKAQLQPFTDWLYSSKDWVKSLAPFIWGAGFLYPIWQQGKKVLASPMAKELRTYLKLPDYGEHLGTIPVMREHIQKLSATRLNWFGIPGFRKNAKGEFECYPLVPFRRQKRLLYIVDDLDRCGHKGIVKVLEAVRLVLDLEHVHVVIAVDQRIALAALAMHYKELETYHPTGDARQIARDYLAKIILLPIQLTKPDEATISGYLESLWLHGATEEQSNNEPATIPNDNPINEAPSSESDDTEQETNGSSHTKENPNQVTSEPQQDNVKEENIAEVESDKKTDKPELEKEVKVIERLSEAQQNAFKHWAGHFELTNPRQLKRLYNGYNFLRNYYGEDTPQAPSAEQAESASKHHFPLLATLCALEYLNDLDDKPLRDALKSQLMGGAALASEEKEGQAIASKITKEIITLAGIKLGTQSGVIVVAYKAVEPFVLPALEATVSKKEKKGN